MMAIQTVYMPATDTRGSRIRAWPENGQVSTAMDYGLNADDNHRRAVGALLEQLKTWGTLKQWRGGWLPSKKNKPGGMAFVRIDR